MKTPFLRLLMALALPLLLGMSKKPETTITFHTMASANDPPKTMFPAELNGRRLLFKIVPEFSQENISAFQAFPAQNGNGKGVALQLDFHGKEMLEMASRAHKDEYLLALVDAKPVDFVVMDEPVSDGMITIWQGVPDTVIKYLEKKYPHIKKNAPPTMSRDLDMLPSTNKEKQKFLQAEKEQEKLDAAGAKSGKKKPDVPSVNIPNAPATPGAPTSPQIPVEGANPSAPNPTPPQGEPPLPKP